MSGNSNTIISDVILTPGGVFDQDNLPPTVDIPTGSQGVGIASISAAPTTDAGVVVLTITYTNGTTQDVPFTAPMGNPGDKGDKGDDGDNGAPGVSVTNIMLVSEGEGSYHFNITLSNGVQIPTDPFTTAKGDMGDQGLSAYQVALAADPNIGTVQEWLASLEGEPGTPAPVINEVTVTQSAGNYELTLGFNEGDDVTSDPFTLAVNESLGSLTDVTLSPSIIPGQTIVYDGSDWINTTPRIVAHADIPAGNQRQLQSLTETLYDPDTGATSTIVWVVEAIAPAAPGDPTSEFSAPPTQYAFADGDTITLTLTADPNTNSYFSALAGADLGDPVIVTNVTSVSGGGEDPDDVWMGEVTSAQPGIGATNITELVVTLTSQTGASQIAGDFTVNMAIVVDNPTTHPADMFNRGYSFTIAEAADTTMAATYSATTYTFDGNDHDNQAGTATLTVSDGVFVGAPTISATAGNLTLGTVTVNAANTIATVPYTITEPAPQAMVPSILTWDATARPVGATGTNGETTEVVGSPQTITVFGEPALTPSASGTPPADTTDSAFAIPTPINFGIDSSSDLSATGHYSYIEEVNGAYPSSGITEITGTNSATTTVQLAGTTAFDDPHDSGYTRRGIQIGWSDGASYTVVDNLEDIQFETYHPILLWYDQTVTSAADITALYPAVDMEATEVIIPSSDDIITGHVFTPTEGNFLMLLIPDTWNVVTAVSVVGDGNDQPAGVTTLPSGQITAINDSFGTPVLYQGFYVTGVTPNVRLRIDSITTS